MNKPYEHDAALIGLLCITYSFLLLLVLTTLIQWFLHDL
jgi:hypothetical protein